MSALATLALVLFWVAFFGLPVREYLSQAAEDRADRRSLHTWDAFRDEMERTP